MQKKYSVEYIRAIGRTITKITKSIESNIVESFLVTWLLIGNPHLLQNKLFFCVLPPHFLQIIIIRL